MNPNSILPQRDSILGPLTVEEVLEEYDGVPVLFVCVNPLGYRFLAVMVGADASGDILLYVPVSMERLNAVRSGLLSLRDAFQLSETETVFVVRPELRGSPEDVLATPANQVEDRWLPANDSYITGRMTPTMPFTVEYLDSLSKQQRRPLCALRFETPEDARTFEFPLAQAGNLLNEFQLLSDVIPLRPQGSGSDPGC